jgi:sulfite reductase (ferredoxin)
VLIGGGLGAQPFSAQTAFEFLEEKDVIPFIEALLRVFDRYGERVRRHKARMKFLLNDLGLEGMMAKWKKNVPLLKTKSSQFLRICLARMKSNPSIMRRVLH